MGRVLSQATVEMKERRKSMKRTLLIFFIAAVVYGFFAAFVYKVKPAGEMIFWSLLIVCIVIVLFCNITIKHEVYQYKRTYKEARIALSKMIKIIDWTVYRKRQLYHANELAVIDTINCFLDESQRRLSPVRDNFRLYRLLSNYLNFAMLFLTSFVLSAYRQYFVSFFLYLHHQIVGKL